MFPSDPGSACLVEKVRKKSLSRRGRRAKKPGTSEGALGDTRWSSSKKQSPRDRQTYKVGGNGVDSQKERPATLSLPYAPEKEEKNWERNSDRTPEEFEIVSI